MELIPMIFMVFRCLLDRYDLHYVSGENLPGSVRNRWVVRQSVTDRSATDRSVTHYDKIKCQKSLLCVPLNNHLIQTLFLKLFSPSEVRRYADKYLTKFYEILKQWIKPGGDQEFKTGSYRRIVENDVGQYYVYDPNLVDRYLEDHYNHDIKEGNFQHLREPNPENDVLYPDDIPAVYRFDVQMELFSYRASRF